MKKEMFLTFSHTRNARTPHNYFFFLYGNRVAAAQQRTKTSFTLYLFVYTRVKYAYK